MAACCSSVRLAMSSNLFSLPSTEGAFSRRYRATTSSTRVVLSSGRKPVSDISIRPCFTMAETYSLAQSSTSVRSGSAAGSASAGSESSGVVSPFAWVESEMGVGSPSFLSSSAKAVAVRPKTMTIASTSASSLFHFLILGVPPNSISDGAGRWLFSGRTQVLRRPYTSLIILQDLRFG